VETGTHGQGPQRLSLAAICFHFALQAWTAPADRALSSALHLAQIDALEVLAETLFDASRTRLRSFRHLAQQVPVYQHGVSLGLASSAPLAEPRLNALVKVADAVCPAGISEHLAFVRGGGREIGHLAAPPRTAATLEGTLVNYARARRSAGVGERGECDRAAGQRV
jgi:uncharacterized protein